MPNRVVYDLSGRVALVTGAGPNIGRVIAATLARVGATVLCNDVKPDIAEAAARFAGEGGHNAHALAFDITDPDAVEQAVETASRAHGTIDILVNNAGVTVPKNILTVSVEEWRLVTRVIQDGAFHCSRAVAKRLIAANKPGTIVNIASTTGHRGRKNAIAYAYRASFTTDALMNGVGVAQVAELLGHQNTEMVTKMIQLVSENYKVHVFPGIRTDAVVAKAIRQRQFIADVDSKSKCLEDYRVVSDQILAGYGIPPENVTNDGEQETSQVA